MVRSGYAFDYFKFSNGKYLKDENFAKKINWVFGKWSLNILGNGENQINKI